MSNRCLRCGWSTTWEDQGRQFGRAIRYGPAPKDAKAIMPRCGKCLTAWKRGDAGPLSAKVPPCC